MPNNRRSFMPSSGHHATRHGGRTAVGLIGSFVATCVAVACDTPDLEQGKGQGNQGAPKLPGHCTVPIPGAQLTVERTKGPPNTGTMTLPPFTAFCLQIDANAASASVELDEASVLGPADFKNSPLVETVEFKDLPAHEHTVAVKVAGKPGSHYVTVTAYYAEVGLANGPAIGTVDEALLVGQAYIDARAQVPMFAAWTDARAVRATPLATRDGGLEAFEVDLESSEGNDAGYVVLEAKAGRPLLGSAATEGPSLSEGLAAEYVATFGPLPPEGQQFLWFGAGLMALETTAADLSTQRVETCADCGPSFKAAERPPVPYAELGLTLEQWVAQRQASVDELLAAFAKAQAKEGDGKVKDMPVVVKQPAGSMGELLALAAPPPPSYFCGLEEYEANQCIEVKEPDTTPTGEVPGGKTAFSDYWQEMGPWPSSDPNGPDECVTGCVPIAALTLLDYYDRLGFGFLIPGDPNDSVKDAEVKTALAELRVVLKTYCKKNPQNPDRPSGSTNPKYLEDLDLYINYRAKAEVGFSIDMGWATNREKCPHPGQRYAAVKAEISQGRPLILDYASNWENGPQCDQNADVETYNPGQHAAVVYGYWDDGDNKKYEDLLAVRTGWKDLRMRYEPIVGTGDTALTQVIPGCAPEQPDALCKTFKDLPEAHWGHTSAKTLSCACVMTGYPDGNFGIEKKISRAEFIKVVMRLAFAQFDLENKRVDLPELGVSKQHWASGYIDKAHELGLLALLLDAQGKLAADGPITRREAAYLLVRAGEDSLEPHFEALYTQFSALKGTEPSPYKDLSPNVGDKYYRYILATTNECVFEGYEQDQTFKPSNPIARIEAAKVTCMAKYGSESNQCSSSPEACKPPKP